MMIKELHLKGRDENGNVFVQPLLGDFEKTAAVKSGNLHPRVQDFVKSVRPSTKGIYVLVNALGASEYWSSNVNGDAFPEKALVHAPSDWDKLSLERQREVAKGWDYGYPTFLNAHVYRHHVNKNPEKALGSIDIVVWNPKMHRVELVVYLDRAKCKEWDAYDIIEKIEQGGFPDVSMGTKVPSDFCSICEHESKTRFDYCHHLLTQMNKILPDGRKVSARNDKPKFFDISFVFIGADKTAKVMAKLAHKGNQVCMGSVCVAPVAALEKAATVPTNIKMFRRAMQMRQQGSHVYHGTPALPGVARSGTLLPAKDIQGEVRTSFSTLPLSDYWGTDTGLMVEKSSIPNLVTNKYNQEHLTTRYPTPIGRGGYVVTGPASSSSEREAATTLQNKYHLRPMDVGIEEEGRLAAERQRRSPLRPIIEKTASFKRRAVSAALASGVGFGSGYGGSVAADKLHKSKVDKKEALREGLGEAIGGAVLGGLIPFTKKAFTIDIEKATEENTNYRKVLHTAKHEQLVAMALPPGGDIGAETHPDTDQFIRVESGTGKSVQDGVESPLSPGSAVVIHAGVRHNIVNTGKTPLKIYTVYSKKQHPDGIVEKTKSDAKRIEKDACGDMLQYFQDHPEKLKEKQERDRKKGLKKTANDPIKKKVEIQGVPIWLEWLKGETRLYKKGKVVKYERLMKADYGYIPETKDSDGEDIDVYLGPDRSASMAYVIRQMKKTDGTFDEHKVMLGYPSEKAARDSYDYHMGGTKEFFGGIKPVPVSALKALFSDNSKEKTAGVCPCPKLDTPDCCMCRSMDKLASALFPTEKAASHKKVSELIKNIPAGPFTKETLPRLENAEQDIPNDVLDIMGGLPLHSALSTPSAMGMVLKPREFQRLMLSHIGENNLANDLDANHRVFGSSSEVDSSIDVDPCCVLDALKQLLCAMGMVKKRSIANPALTHRITIISLGRLGSEMGSGPQKALLPTNTPESDPLLKKLAAAYNGYRRSLVKKAADIQKQLVSDPQLYTELFGESMAQAFAGGIDKTAASVLGPDSLAYLSGVHYQDRDFHLTSDEAVASLAQTGVFVEAPA